VCSVHNMTKLKPTSINQPASGESGDCFIWVQSFGKHTNHVLIVSTSTRGVNHALIILTETSIKCRWFVELSLEHVIVCASVFKSWNHVADVFSDEEIRRPLNDAESTHWRSASRQKSSTNTIITFLQGFYLLDHEFSWDDWQASSEHCSLYGSAIQLLNIAEISVSIRLGQKIRDENVPLSCWT